MRRSSLCPKLVAFAISSCLGGTSPPGRWEDGSVSYFSSHTHASPWCLPVVFPHCGAVRAKLEAPGGRTGPVISWSLWLAPAGKISLRAQAVGEHYRVSNKTRAKEFLQLLGSLHAPCSTEGLYFLPCSVGSPKFSWFIFLFCFHLLMSLLLGLCTTLKHHAHLI